MGGAWATGGVFTTGGARTTAGTLASGGMAAGGESSVPPSCRALTTPCLGRDCCESINVTPGSYLRGRSEVVGVGDYYDAVADPEVPEHVAQVSYPFALDKFEVTVARFRAFVGEYDTWHAFGLNPRVGSGAHPSIPGTGWQQIWFDDTAHVPADAAALIALLHCHASYATWTDEPSSLSDNLPINCVNWYMAAEFCIWDGGRLPTETEWEYVAANGSANQLYPWGSAAPDVSRANYSDTDNTPFLPVGSKPAGAGALGHLDLAGSVNEWVFDSLGFNIYPQYATTPCVDCYFTSESGVFGGTTPNNVLRGGAWDSDASWARAAHRGGTTRYVASHSNGIRCARTPTPNLQ